MKVTFDSNVWEKVVRGEQGFHHIRDKIVSGVIQPYICEIAISLESIKREERPRFWNTYEPKMEFKELPRLGRVLIIKEIISVKF